MDMSSTIIRRPLLTIRASKGFAALNLPEVWQFRELFGGLAYRDVKLRYRQTALGVIWVILQPLLAAGIFSFVFGTVAKMPSEGPWPYFVFSYAGLLAWNAFQSTLNKASSCLVGNANLVSKVYFPRLILPLSIVPSSLIDLGVAAVLMIGLMVKWHINPGIVPLLLLPVWLLVLLMLALGVGLYAAALMVSYRDVQFILPVAVQFLLYGSPITYSISKVPAQYLNYYMLNPLAELMVAFRWSLLGSAAPDPRWVAYSCVISLLVFVVGAVTFKRMERSFADVI
jgi:lipopolysaccharide transport system permease protein